MSNYLDRKPQGIFTFFKRKADKSEDIVDIPRIENSHPSKCLRINAKEVDVDVKSLERNVGLCTQIWNYLLNGIKFVELILQQAHTKLYFHHIHLMIKNILVDFNHRGLL